MPLCCLAMPNGGQGAVAERLAGLPLVARVDGRNHPKAGETVTLVPNPKHMHVFDAVSGARL